MEAMLAWVAVSVWLAGSPLAAQATCGADGYRVVAQRWDVVLKTGWEMRQDCAHPERPAHFVPLRSIAPAAVGDRPQALAAPVQVSPLLVQAGEPVRLWLQDEVVRIEMSGIAERSAHSGDRVLVRVTRQDASDGRTVQYIPGTVRGVADVEMER
jgi:hypothetical protein